MCGRFVRRKASEVYAELFEVDSVPAGPSYNIAPTQPVAVVRMKDNHRACALMRWGLIPFWSKDSKQSFINARADTALQKPAFRDSMRTRRCLVLADGYYEWKTEGKAKKPFLFQLRDERPFAFAGLWDCWKGPDGPVESCTIITTEANELSGSVHDRMPVILSRAACQLWLDPKADDVERLQGVLKPYPSDEMECYPVSPIVNNVKNDSAECIERVA